jgi:ketol-acid reductoisomerase
MALKDISNLYNKVKRIKKNNFMTKVALLGAGGKMGVRLTQNLKQSDYDVSYLEVSPDGIERVEKNGLSVTTINEAIPVADIIIFAVPDVLIGKIAEQIVPLMKSGAMGMCLDPAAPLAGYLPKRRRGADR